MTRAIACFALLTAANAFTPFAPLAKPRKSGHRYSGGIRGSAFASSAQSTATRLLMSSDLSEYSSETNLTPPGYGFDASGSRIMDLTGGTGERR